METKVAANADGRFPKVNGAALRTRIVYNLIFARQIPKLRRVSSRTRSLLLSHSAEWLNWILKYHGSLLGGVDSFERQRPVAAENEPIPWYTYPAIEYLSQIDFSGASVFEFGSGYSSLWWSQRVRYVCSVESDPEWYRELSPRARANHSLVLQTGRSAYANAFLQSDVDYDVFVIDGIHRRLCVESVLKHRRPHSVIIFDNSDWFPACCELITSAGLQQIDFVGAGPVNRYAWATSIFLPPGPSLLSQHHRWKVHVNGGLQVVADEDVGEAGSSL